MADLISDGKTKVAWATAISSVSAPTVAELTAAQDFTTRVTPDGLKTDASTESVDTSSLASTFTTSEAGRRGYDIEVTFKRGDTPTEDAPWATLKYKTYGFLIVRRGVAYDTAFSADQEIEVYPVVCGERQSAAPAANEVSKFVSPMMLREEPDTAALVAA